MSDSSLEAGARMKYAASFLFLVLFSLASASDGPVTPEANTPGFKVITFDWFAAIVDNLYDDVERCLDELFRSRELDVSYTTIKTMTKEWISQYSRVKEMSLLARNDNVKWGNKNLFGQFRDHSWGNVLSKHAEARKAGLSGDEVAQCWWKLTPQRDALKTLQGLRSAGYKLALLSNGDEETLRNGAKHAFNNQFEFDDYLGSDTVPEGAFKPDPKIYATALRVRTDGDDILTKEDILHVAGASFDAIGAKVYGFSTCWNGRGKTLGDVDNITGNEDYNPTWILKSLSDLPKVLQLGAVEMVTRETSPLDV